MATEDGGLFEAMEEMTGVRYTSVPNAWRAIIAAAEGTSTATFEALVLLVVGFPDVGAGIAVALDDDGRLTLAVEPYRALELADELRAAAERAHASRIA